MKPPIACLALAALVLGPAAVAQDLTGKTYMLSHRELPDGTTQHPPEAYGLLSFTEEFRNFNIATKNPDGTWSTASIMATYMLGLDQYCQTMWFGHRVNVGGPGVTTMPPENSGPCVPVTTDGDTFTFQPEGEPVLVFSGDGMVATQEGEFVDYWTLTDDSPQ